MTDRKVDFDFVAQTENLSPDKNSKVNRWIICTFLLAKDLIGKKRILRIGKSVPVLTAASRSR
jgi:hypothetical protein